VGTDTKNLYLETLRLRCCSSQHSFFCVETWTSRSHVGVDWFAVLRRLHLFSFSSAKRINNQSITAACCYYSSAAVPRGASRAEVAAIRFVSRRIAADLTRLDTATNRAVGRRAPRLPVRGCRWRPPGDRPDVFAPRPRNLPKINGTSAPPRFLSITVTGTRDFGQKDGQYSQTSFSRQNVPDL